MVCFWASPAAKPVSPKKRPFRESKFLLGVLELSLSGEVLHEIPFLWLEGKEDKETKMDDVMPFFQIALSPDGKVMAASTALFDLKKEDRALFLADLESPERKVTKISVPVP